MQKAPTLSLLAVPDLCLPTEQVSSWNPARTLPLVRSFTLGAESAHTETGPDFQGLCLTALHPQHVLRAPQYLFICKCLQLALKPLLQQNAWFPAWKDGVTGDKHEGVVAVGTEPVCEAGDGIALNSVQSHAL